MITRLELLLKTEDDKRLKHSDGSFFQGYLMSLLDKEYVEWLHTNPLNPYSQYIFYDKEKDCCVWRIATLNEEARKQIIMPLLNLDLKQFHIDGSDTDYKVLSKGITVETDYQTISDKYFLSENNLRYINLSTKTPVTFKSNERYQNFPDVKSLYVSLYNKWNMFNTGISLESDETLEHLTENTILDKYELRSANFTTDGAKIKSFLGDFTLYVKGPAPLVNIANMLFNYAQYSGLGAKTGMGMGGVENEQ